MDRRILKTKTAIQAAYFKLLITKQSGKISISEIAREANIDRKTFYLHYESVEDIMKDFSMIKFTELKQNLEESGFFKEPLNISCVFQSLNAILEADMELYRKFAKNVNFDVFWTLVRNLMIDTIISFYSGMFTFPESYIRIYAEFLSTGTITVYQSWLKEEIDLPLEDLGKAVCKIMNEGVQSLVPELKPYLYDTDDQL